MKETITDDFRFLSQLSTFMFALQSIGMVNPITRNAEIRILRLTILPRDIILT